ncbi:MAG: hypothetical protein ACOYOU_06740 [Kiritimatiellia bacterium]
MRSTIVLAVCAVWSGLVPAVGANASLTFDDVAKSKAAYQLKLKEFKQESAVVKSELVLRYRKTLDAIRTAAKQKGDLEKVQSVDAEITRFDEQKQLPPQAAATATPEIAKADRMCREAMEKADLESAQKVVDYIDKHLRFIDQCKKQAVRDDKLALAKAFDAELKDVREVPEYQAAKFLCADKKNAEAEKYVPPEASPAMNHKVAAAVASNAPPPALPPGRIGGTGIQPRIDPKGLYDAQRIYTGQPATAPTVSSLKQLAVSETGKAPPVGTVGVALDGSLDNENAKYQLRVKLRHKVTGATYTNVKVLAQYFIKNAGGGIQEGGMQFVLVPALDAKGSTCEMKTEELPYASNYVYNNRSGSSHMIREGTFLGVVVSVFSSDDKMIGQVTSVNMLKERGKTAFELPIAWQEGAANR